MAKYTFEQLMNMDVFSRAEAVNSMTEQERKEIIVPTIDSVKANKNLYESMAKTPAGKHLAEI